MEKNYLPQLQKYSLENAWAIQDLSLWPGRTKFFAKENNQKKELSHLLISGHPSQERKPMLTMGDQGNEVETLFSHIPPAPFCIRETSSKILPKLRPLFANFKLAMEWRMDANRASFKQVSNHKIKQLKLEDAPALAKFCKVPPQAADGMKMWIQSAVIMAAFVENEIVSMGTTIVRTKDVWMLAGIETLPEFRGKGYGADITAALTSAGLEVVPTVTLTVFQDNDIAQRLYKKLGFKTRDESFWMDVNT